MARYQITTHPAYAGTVYHLHDTVRRAEAVLYPEFGNNCAEFRTTPDPDGKDASGADCTPVELFVPPADMEDLRRGSPFHSGQPILFPFPNRVRAGTFTFEGRTVKMEQLLAKGWDRGAGQAIHGVVADRAWTVEAAQADDESGAVVRSFLQLDSFPDIFTQYPYPCRLTVTYRLREGVLQMETEVANTGTGNMPMGFGIHPWFPVTLRPGVKLPAALDEITDEQRARSEVHVPASGYWELENLMPNGRILPVDAPPGTMDLRQFRPLDGHTFDNVFTGVERRADGWSEGGLRDPSSGLEMYVAADKQFREWVLYAPLNRRVIALEPYTCTTDAVNLQPQGIDAGLIVLPAGQTWRGDIHFGLRRASA
ncbi:MAG TPA: aldose 1-epimerase [Chthonomonadaceae bacterium]|nr:aldose 1-epimerase [Chthonomonadaceae bacterium]